MRNKDENIIDDKIRNNIEIIFNKILEFNKINKTYYDNKMRDYALQQKYKNTITQIILDSILGKGKPQDDDYSRLRELLEGFFSIVDYIINALYSIDDRHGYHIEEWRQHFDALSIRNSVFTMLAGSKQGSSALKAICGDAYISDRQNLLRLVNLDTKSTVAVVEGSTLTSATLPDKIKVLEIDRSLVSNIENVRSWSAFVRSYMAKINATHSIAVYNIDLLYDTTITLKPIETYLIDVEKASALLESLMRPQPFVGYVQGRFFDFLEEIRRLYDEGWDWNRNGLNIIYKKAGSIFTKYVNRFLGRDARISLLGLQVFALVGDVRLIIPRGSMSILSIYCPANMILEIDGDSTKCDERSYITVKPPRPWSKEGDVASFVKLYINAAARGSTVKVLFE